MVLLALPHGESAALARDLPPPTMIMDLGADYRLTSSDVWGAFYGGEHAGSWTCGLPELPGARETIRSSTKVANPGCYPISVALALAPVTQAGALEPTGIVVVATSGTSGAGRKASDALLATTIMGSMSAYEVGGVHQHTPEMEQSIAAAGGLDIGNIQLAFTRVLFRRSHDRCSSVTDR